MPTREHRQTCGDCLGYEVYETSNDSGSWGSGYESFGRYCDNCGESWRCQDCTGGNYFTCGDCQYHDDYYEDDYDGRIYDYGYKPELIFKGDRSQPMMGVELEVGRSQTVIADTVEMFTGHSQEHLYMKEDSSIQGVEIVTHPMTLQYAREYNFGKLLRELRRNGCEVDSGYGLHIHVGRKSFRKLPFEPKPLPQKMRELRMRSQPAIQSRSAVHQMMWLLFMARNVTELQKLGRRVSTWGSFRQQAKGEVARKAKGERAGGRDAVNCQNVHTYELRFFKSTLDEQEFYAGVEFADASVRYTRDTTSKDVLHGKALTWPQFAKWVKEHDYPHLLAEITK